MKKYDVIIVGSGSGTIVLEAALNQGLKCALIEKGKFGGTCLTRGCIPTKILVTAADYIREIDEMSHVGLNVSNVSMDWATISKRVWQKINLSKDILANYQKTLNLDLYQGEAKFTSDKSMTVLYDDGSTSQEITADKILIAVGARSKIPQLPGLEETGYLSSESFFGDKYPTTPPQSLIIVGGGPIGTEFAHIFAAAGTKVTLVQHNVRLLPKEDADISERILSILRHSGIDVRLNISTRSIHKQGDKKVLVCAERSTGEEFSLSADEILFASGVTPNTDTLNLSKTSLETDKSGYIITNEFLETSINGVWACGDVNGQPAFRHKANYEAEIIAHNLFTNNSIDNIRWARYDLVPAVTFTYPQVAHVGLTEQQAKDKGHNVKTGLHKFSDTAKGFALGLEPGSPYDGFAKIVVDEHSYNILGMHIIGPQASILIQPFVNLLNAGPITLTPINEHIASPTTIQLRKMPLKRNLEPHSVLSVGETMTPHPALSEVPMWTKYYFEEENTNSH